VLSGGVADRVCARRWKVDGVGAISGDEKVMVVCETVERSGVQRCL